MKQAEVRAGERRGRFAHVIGMTVSATSVGLASGAFFPTLVCFLSLAAAMVVFRFAEGEKRKAHPAHRAYWQKVQIVANIAAVLTAPGLATVCLAFGGEIGRVVGSLVLINGVLSIILNASLHRGHLLAPVMTPVVGLAIIPLWPLTPTVAPHWMQMIGLYLSMGCLLWTLFQTLRDQRKAMQSLRDAMFEADERRREADEKRIEAEGATRAKSDFMIMISHEFRTPLNAVIGYSEMLGEELSAEGKDSAAADSKRIREAGHRLLDMVEQVLELSSTEHAHARLETAPVCFMELTADVAASTEKLAAVNRNTFRYQVQDDLEQGMADAAKIRQCLAHLLSNACKFTTSGVIALDVRKSEDGRALQCSVADTGIGIARDKLADLFKPFQQAETGFNRRFDGAGLGLATTQRLVRAMGGDIAVESMPGRGSTFTLSIPYRPVTANDALAAAAA